MQKVSITELLSRNSTKPCLALIHRHGKKARNHEELQEALAELYGEAPEKISIEQEFANLHPHKEFILRNCAAPKLPSNEGENYSGACGCGSSGADGSGGQSVSSTVLVPPQRATELVLAMGFGILIGAVIFRMAHR